MPDFEADIAAGQHAETSLKLLGAQRELGDDELPQLYGYPAELTGSWVRANFITSLDGGATVEGLSGALAGPGDRIGVRPAAGTRRRHRGRRGHGPFGGLLGRAGEQSPSASIGRRRSQSEVPPLAIVTKTGHLDRDLAVFTRTEVPPLVLTCTAAADADAPPAGRADRRGDRLLRRRSRRGRRGRHPGGPAGPRAAPRPDRRRADAARRVHRGATCSTSCA